MAVDLSAELIETALGAGSPRPVRYLDAVGSTNTVASEWAAEGAPEGALVVTDHQTGGRGRWGRSWFSAPGKLLQFSLILRPELPPARHGLLTAGLGVATARAVRDLTGLAARIKWPNDVVIGGRKVAGILVESTMVDSKIAAAICGIGINVGLGADDIPADIAERATSLAIEIERAGGGGLPPRTELLARILEKVDAIYPSVTGDTADLLAAATELSAVLGERVTVRYVDGGSLVGTAEGFDPDGALRVSTSSGVEVVRVGEIEQLR